jgi:hypothetical protein
LICTEIDWLILGGRSKQFRVLTQEIVGRLLLKITKENFGFRGSLLVVQFERSANQ